MRKLIIALVVLSVGLIATPGSAGHNTKTESYTAGSLGDFTGGTCADDSPTGENLDQVCFSVVAGKSYRVTLMDVVTGPHVGYLWTFKDANGGCVGDSPDPLGGCDNAGLTCGPATLTAPPTAVLLEILLDGPVFGPFDCLLNGPGDSPGFATQGTVSLTTLH